jgi:hypothetical protein
MHASKLVAGAGQGFESACQLTSIAWNRQGAMATRAIPAEVSGPNPLGSTLRLYPKTARLSKIWAQASCT